MGTYQPRIGKIKMCIFGGHQFSIKYHDFSTKKFGHYFCSKRFDLKVVSQDKPKKDGDAGMSEGAHFTN